MVIKLEARGVCFAYSENAPILVDVNLMLVPGELSCIIGPNGAGKSTLLKVLAGLLTPDAGSVVLSNDPVHLLKPRIRAREISLVPQSLSRIPEVLVRDFVFGGRYGHLGLFGASKLRDIEASREALEAADALEFKERDLGSLSGGQLQRVLIARALAQEAENLLVDEPTNSLDPEHQIGVFSLLRELTDRGKAGLVVTHDMNLASQFAHRIHLMKEGRIVVSGSPVDVLRAEVLKPVYGEQLRFGAWPTASGDRPYVIPWV